MTMIKNDSGDTIISFTKENVLDYYILQIYMFSVIFTYIDKVSIIIIVTIITTTSSYH